MADHIMMDIADHTRMNSRSYKGGYIADHVRIYI